MAECEERGEEGSKVNILINEQVDKEAWNKFVQDNPKGNIFQTYEFYEIYARTKKILPLLIAAKDNTENITAGALGFFSNEIGGIGKHFSSRAVIIGGPLGSKHEEIEVIIKEFDRLAKRKALFCQIRNIHDTSSLDKVLKTASYVFEPHLNFLLDLNQKKEVLWSQMTKARRNGVTKAKRMGVKVREVNKKEEFESCYGLLKQTYKHAKLPLADVSLFKGAFSLFYPKGMIKIFIAETEATPIGVIFLILYKDRAYDWYAGASSEHLVYCPNDLLVWHGIEWASQQGYKVFDFGGAGHPNKPYGVREFKRQFGGEEFNFGRYEKVYSPLKLKLAKMGFKIHKKVLNR